VPAIVLFLAAIGFGASRDFGAFFLALLVLPCLALVTLIWIGAAALAPGRQGRCLGIAIAVALLAAPAFLVAGALRDRVRFAGWAVANGPLERLTQRNAVLAWWDSWGMAGSENDSYLVADPDDSIGTIAAAERWRRHRHLSCEIVDSRRMAARVYIVTTYNCPFGFDGHRWS
jgi:hypothetical protein